MRMAWKSFGGLLITTLLCSCSSSVSTNESVRPSTPTTVDRDSLFRKGRGFYVERNYDSAAVYYRKSFALDSTYQAPLSSLAQLHYERAMQIEDRSDPARTREFENSLRYSMALESRGHHDIDLYDRLTELTYELGKKDLFLSFVKKRMAESTDDRQYFNLGLAYGQVGDNTNVIKCQKEAIERYRFSPFIGGFYRQLGNAYMDVERQQSAERTFSSGVGVVNERLSEIAKNGAVVLQSEVDRLKEDRLSMLRSLRKIYRIHGQTEKLRDVERQLEGQGE